MLTSSNKIRTASGGNDWLAVLFLPSPPSNHKALFWYWKKIAGVPFLLRNILNIQRSGIKHLAIFSSNTDTTLPDVCPLIIRDPRVQLKLHWLSNLNQLSAVSKGMGNLLFLDGSVLLERKQLESALNPPSGQEGDKPSQVVSLDEILSGSTLEKPEHFDFSKFHQISGQSHFAQSGAIVPKPLVYCPKWDNLKISKEADFQIEGNRIIENSGGLKNDSFITRKLSRPVSQRFTRLFLNTSFTPNQITILSFILGLGSALCFYPGGYALGLTGAVLLLFSIWLDGADGEIARIKFMESAIGGKLDIYCDNVVHIAVFLSIGMGLFHAQGSVIFAYLGGFATMGSLISFLILHASIIEGKSHLKSANKNNPHMKQFVDKLANRDFIHFLFLLALMNQLALFLWFAAIGVSLLAVYLLFEKIKPLNLATSKNDGN